ncbi:MAG: hypothetical protein AB7L28_20820, partial [Kofleriaceae bacterium]
MRAIGCAIAASTRGGVHHVFEIAARGARDRVRTALSGRDRQIATRGIRMAMRAAMKSRRHCSPISIAPSRCLSREMGNRSVGICFRRLSGGLPKIIYGVSARGGRIGLLDQL